MEFPLNRSETFDGGFVGWFLLYVVPMVITEHLLIHEFALETSQTYSSTIQIASRFRYATLQLPFI